MCLKGLFLIIKIRHYRKMQSQEEELVELANTKMPFGKYGGRYLVDLPETLFYGSKVKVIPRASSATSCAQSKK